MFWLLSILDVQKQIVMQVHKVIDKRQNQNQGQYLIHWLGQHKTNAKWYNKEQLLIEYPQAIQAVQKYDQNLRSRYQRLCRTHSHKDLLINNHHNKPKADESKKIIKMRKATRKNHDKLFDLAKEQLHSEGTNQLILGEELTIPILTTNKYNCHWVFGDKIDKIQGKLAGQAIYQVSWQDGSQSKLHENDLLQKQCYKLIQYWEERLFKDETVQPKKHQSPRTKYLLKNQHQQFL